MALTRVKKGCLVLSALVLLLLAIGAWCWHTFLDAPLLHDDVPVVLEIKPNTSAIALSQLLYDKHLIPSRRHFLLLLKWEGHLHDLKAGVYQILPGQSIQDLIHKIVVGDVFKQSFRIIDGSTLAQVISNLKAAPWLHYNASDWQFIPVQYVNAEGLLLADTYYYGAGSDAKHLLKQAHANLMSVLEKNWQDRSPDLPYKTPYEMLVVASIIEKESAVPSERVIISGVVVNRLKKHMPLQMDPTVIYAMGSNYTGKLSHNDMSVDSPYNTYRYKGLPPTPIAMAGKDAIYAAAHPQASNYLYFVAKGDGTHTFSETYTDQKKAINQYMSGGH